MLELLRHTRTINGAEIEQAPSLFTWGTPARIVIDEPNNVIAFKIQKGPIKEAGLNGCQVDALLAVASELIARANHTHPCKENSDAVQHIETALAALEARRKNREARGVEGTSKT